MRFLWPFRFLPERQGKNTKNLVWGKKKSEINAYWFWSFGTRGFGGRLSVFSGFFGKKLAEWKNVCIFTVIMCLS
jgi:hypothetical protein